MECHSHGSCPWFSFFFFFFFFPGQLGFKPRLNNVRFSSRVFVSSAAWKGPLGHRSLPAEPPSAPSFVSFLFLKMRLRSHQIGRTREGLSGTGVRRTPSSPCCIVEVAVWVLLAGGCIVRNPFALGKEMGQQMVISCVTVSVRGGYIRAPLCCPFSRKKMLIQKPSRPSPTT